MLNRKPLGTHRSFHDLMLDYDLLIRPASLPKWRLLFPNVGELSGFPQFGNVMICATDGLEAFFHVDDSGFLWKGHLKMFTGPVAKTYVWEEDWDYVARKRRVDVRKRADGSVVVIPRDSFWQEYWEIHPRTPQWEVEFLQKFLFIDGMTIHHGEVSFADFDEAFEQMQQRSSSANTASPRKKELTERQRILATL